jgi:hypothetical protein
METVLMDFVCSQIQTAIPKIYHPFQNALVRLFTRDDPRKILTESARFVAPIIGT